ncbi:HypC/HybG/HupF family hydrogenase formation chaperone [Aromatoleum evansii]|uniref:HypC/HybG/HupF family hydrogenase formation chaperone n=1 Tax=Aromatoleum evansii TaxID=59406 RepID=UPI001FEA27FE|nr:HypC/HybG/HupF family hydrogenase formation chaperone [Aromatoleum evansii]
MCLSVPMQVDSWVGDGEIAWVVRGERRQQANMLLVGPQPVGTWVLVALGFAKDVLDEESLALTEEALAALAATLDGDYDPEAWFGDLRTPAAECDPGSVGAASAANGRRFAAEAAPTAATPSTAEPVETAATETP